MLFGSIEFYIFVAITFCCWLVCPLKHRWSILLAASYIFYFSWKPWYCLILIFCTLATWLAGSMLGQRNKLEKRKGILALAVVINLLPLLFFKYFNFFNDSFAGLFGVADISYPVPHLDIILPVGISFYSFQAISYCVDVYRGKIEAEGHIGHFSLYLAFFPKLISGPIERGGSLLPQIVEGSRFSRELFMSGVLLFGWGLFKKIVIADRLAMYVNMVFSSPEGFYGQSAILAIWLFSLQIYCDFSAYTDMAIGCGRMFGIELSRNFYFPYFARSITEFWQRWHITLTSWFRDYLYIPLGGNRVAEGRFAVNIMIVFLVSGLWHGAAWNFVFWGAIHGVLYLMEKFTLPLRKRSADFFSINGRLLDVVKIVITFNLVSLAWVFFRAANIEDAFTIIGNAFMHLELPIRMMSSQFSTYLACCFAVFFILSEIVLYWSSRTEHRFLLSLPAVVRYPTYAIGLLVISLFGLSSNEFIYFHF